jgi:hypothetical protein
MRPGITVLCLIVAMALGVAMGTVVKFGLGYDMCIYADDCNFATDHGTRDS